MAAVSLNNFFFNAYISFSGHVIGIGDTPRTLSIKNLFFQIFNATSFVAIPLGAAKIWTAINPVTAGLWGAVAWLVRKVIFAITGVLFQEIDSVKKFLITSLIRAIVTPILCTTIMNAAGFFITGGTSAVLLTMSLTGTFYLIGCSFFITRVTLLIVQIFEPIIRSIGNCLRPAYEELSPYFL